MKPCSRNRRDIAWLALDSLDARTEYDLRAHLEACAGCREYFDELSNLSAKLSAAEPNSPAEVPRSFHGEWTAKIRVTSASPTFVTRLFAVFQATVRNWRIITPSGAAAAALVIGMAVFLHRRSEVKLDSFPKVVSLSPIDKSFAPTISNYQMVANRSLDKLDQLLNEQAIYAPSPAPIYTPASVARAELTE